MSYYARSENQRDWDSIESLYNIYLLNTHSVQHTEADNEHIKTQNNKMSLIYRDIVNITTELSVQSMTIQHP